ncbi:hypothetical protein DH2020_009853 [Rehmannia glutinosa]|uniref:Protein kinase domain-containing protein n=1 Tax=Rehmannia glutinosa TaxID=99300 RepID=A0ABR0X9V2_REHGL
MSIIYDNWERLVAAVVKREEIWQLCHEHSRSPSICSESSDFSDCFQLEKIQESSVPKLVFHGSSTHGFTLKDTLKAEQELGKGTFGTTTLARLLHDIKFPDHEFLARGTQVVMKLLNEVKVTEEEFKQQMKVLANCRHENVSAPRGYYFSNTADGKLVVYDYHSRGSVSDMLRGNKGHANWESRLKIAIGAARGIAHIHTRFGGKLAHGNIKASNIFLNSQNYGCVSEFSLSGITEEPRHSGALGYHPPIYYFDDVPQEGDIYSFGILLVELLTGKSPMEAQGFDQDMHLVSWARSIKSQEWTSKLFDKSLKRPIRYEKDVLEMMETEIPGVHLPSVTDWEAVRAILGSHFRSMARVPADYFAVQDLSEMKEMLEVAVRCLAVSPGFGPKMSDVVLMLEDIGKHYHNPGNKERTSISWYTDLKSYAEVSKLKPSDVYSFGVLMIELVTRRSPLHYTGRHETFVDWAIHNARYEWTAIVFDTGLLKDPLVKQRMWDMLGVALSCVKKEPEERPNMEDVVKMLESLPI